MIWKCFVILIVLVSTMLLGVVGCGSDAEEPGVFMEEKSEKPVIEPAVPLSSKADLFGSWEVVSIYGETPREFLTEGETEAGVMEKLNLFRLDFAEDDSWIWNLSTEIVFEDHTNIPPGEVESIGTWTGTYSVETSTLTFILTESDTSITSKPQGFYEALTGWTEEEGEQLADESFRSDIFGPIRKSNVTKQGDLLILITAAGKKMVFERR